MNAKGLIEQLAASGRHSFTSEEARDALQVSRDACKQALNKLSRQGVIASPARGFYTIVPPEYRSLGCLPAEQFIPALMAQKGLVYYAGLLSAAQYYGAAHQRPQEFQVFIANSRRPLYCGKVRIRFIARKNIAQVPTKAFNTPRGTLQVSTPEATAIDLVGYPEHVGGLDQVATILAELAEEISPEALATAATTAPITWIQRLGHILEIVEAKTLAQSLRPYVNAHAREYSALVPGGKAGGDKNATWKLRVNETLAPDL